MANMREILGVRFLGGEMTADAANDSMSARLLSYKAVVYSHLTTPLRLPLLTTDAPATQADSEVTGDVTDATALASNAISASATSASCFNPEMV